LGAAGVGLAAGGPGPVIAPNDRDAMLPVRRVRGTIQKEDVPTPGGM
jgi:hypothetical protein